MNFILGLALFAIGTGVGLTILLPLAIYGELTFDEMNPYLRWCEFTVTMAAATMGFVVLVRECEMTEKIARLVVDARKIILKLTLKKPKHEPGEQGKN